MTAARVTQEIIEIAQPSDLVCSIRNTQVIIEVASEFVGENRVTQEIIEVTQELVETPDQMRVTQAVTETSVVPDTANVRITQSVIEDERLPETANVRISQSVIENERRPSTANIRISQSVIELLRPNNPPPPRGLRTEYIHRRHFPGN
jgi:hypothetical protein